MKKNIIHFTLLYTVMLMISLIAVSLFEPVFGAQSEDHSEEPILVESPEESDDIKGSGHSEALESIGTSEGKEESEEQEDTRIAGEEIEGHKNEESIQGFEDTDNSSENECTQKQPEQETLEDDTGREEAYKNDNEDNTTTETADEGTVLNQNAIDASETEIISEKTEETGDTIEQNSISTNSMDSEQKQETDLIDSGNCGEEAIWNLRGTDDNYILIISGSGTMDDFSESSIPWAYVRAKIKKVIIEDGITYIGNYAFYSLNKMEEITLPGSILSIGSYSFAYCTSLKYVLIPSNVDRIGHYSFLQCSNLKEIHICSVGAWLKLDRTDSLLEGDLYLNDELLTNVVIPDGVTDIPERAFKNCRNIVSVDFPGSVTRIGASAFSGCDNLTNIIIPGNVTNIGNYAFSHCNNLQKLTLEEGVTSIEEYAFFYCKNLSSVTIPKSLTNIGRFAFSYCERIKEVNIASLEAWLTIEAYSSPAGNLLINGEPLINIVIPDGMTSIRSCAFQGCSSIESVTIPDSVTSIGGSVFQGCSNLKCINIPGGITHIPNAAFYGCKSITSLTIPDNVVSIDEYAFYDCENLTSLTIPDSVISIGTGAFGWKRGLTNVIIYFRGTETQWTKAISGSEVYYKAIVFNTFSVDALFTLSATSFTYTGRSINPAVTVTYNDRTLIENVDYNLTYENNINAGMAMVKINGIGKYSGTAERIFTIQRASIRDAEVTGIENKTFNASKQTQKIAIGIGSTILQPSVDYRVYYSDNTRAGTATITIVGYGNYCDEINKSFTIAKASQIINTKVNDSSIVVGNTTKIVASGAHETGKYTYSSSNNSIATVSSDGVVTGKSPGKAFIIINTPQTINYKAGSKSITILVTEPMIKKPGNCRFVNWNNSKYSSCNVAWNKVEDAQGYQTYYSWTDGSHVSVTTVKSNVLSRKCAVATNHVSQMRVRALVKAAGKTYYGPWSNVTYITPSPTKLTTKNVSPSSKNLQMNISWNIIYGCNGYNVFLTTNPNGKWVWNKSSSAKANDTRALITRYKGLKLKKNIRYYVRIVTRRKHNGVFCTVPVPAKNTYVGSFIIM